MNDSTAPRRGNGLALFALIVALAALFFSLCYDPLKPGFGLKVPFSSGLSGYDTDTASGMYRTELEVRYGIDLRAELELERRLRSKEDKEKLDTLKIEPEIEVKLDRDDKDNYTGEVRVLLVSYKQDGKERKDVITMEKHRESGLWRRHEVSLDQIGAKHKDAAKKMDEWRGAARK